MSVFMQFFMKGSYVKATGVSVLVSDRLMACLEYTYIETRMLKRLIFTVVLFHYAVMAFFGELSLNFWLIGL